MTTPPPPTSSPDPAQPIHTGDVAWTEFHHGDHFAIRYRHLSEATGPQPYKIGVSIEELAPGKQNNPAHYHLREEEHVLVLDGALTARIGAARHVMVAGDYVRFPAGAADGHCLYNHTNVVCRYLVIGDRDPSDVVVYPDSGKVLVRALRTMLDHTATRDYWHGEAPDPSLPGGPGAG